MKLVRPAVLSLVLISAVHARAQEPDAWSKARWHFGPLALSPAISIKNIGVDTNVFNSVQDPKKDFTTTFGPRADWWLRAGPGRLAGTTEFDFVYFAKYSAERGINQGHRAAADLPLSRIRLHAGAGFLDTNDRPGYEIDARARHTEASVEGGVEVRLFGKTRLSLGASGTTYRFTGDVAFLGSQLNLVLNRTSSSATALLRHALTPLTTVTFQADFIRDRFQHSPDRDSTGTRFLAGVELDPFALIKGRASIGYRKLRTPSPESPDFSGLVGSADLSYVFQGMTRFGIGVSRDLQNSFELSEPFYVQSGFGVSATQALLARWDATARAGRYSLAYQRTDSAGSTETGRVDHYTTWGGGIGYRLGVDTRVGLNLDHFRRQSPISTRDYSGLRGGLAVTYGF